jgi:transcriptional regulator with AAA-type ATPase domain
VSILAPAERALLRTISDLAYCNPFLAERVALERAVLGGEFVEGEPVWSMQVEDPDRPRVNVWKIIALLEPVVDRFSERLGAARTASSSDLVLYEDAVLHLMYHHCFPRFFEAVAGAAKPRRWHLYEEFLTEWERYFSSPGVTLPTNHAPEHTFACFYQIVRAFHHIFTHIIGSSLSAARLRAAVWDSIFTHDMRRYRRGLYARMADFATLIMGPSGTGKELVARAIAFSRYVPFDGTKLAFEHDPDQMFHPINIAALPATLIESELFGHRRGAFTGALEDRKGWLETCPSFGSVFLDELGDLEFAVQVKLLRVIETRTFHPVGGTASRQFLGKLIAATNRDLAADMRQGRFREDLYYRLCSDVITTPPLCEQVQESPRAMRELVRYMANRVAGAEAESLAGDVETWIGEHLGPDYTWPGNYRELEQCVRNFLIRKDYRPVASRKTSSLESLSDDLLNGRLTADELLSRYCTLVYSRTGSYEETARRLKLDRRTIKSRIDPQFLSEVGSVANRVESRGSNRRDR